MILQPCFQTHLWNRLSYHYSTFMSRCDHRVSSFSFSVANHLVQVESLRACLDRAQTLAHKQQGLLELPFSKSSLVQICFWKKRFICAYAS